MFVKGCSNFQYCEGIYGGIPITLKKLQGFLISIKDCELNLFKWFIFLTNDRNIYFSPSN